MDKTENIVFFIGKDGKLYDKNFNEVLYNGESITNIEEVLFYCREDGLYGSRIGSNNIIRVLGQAVEVFSFNLYGFCCFVDSENVIVEFNGSFYKMTYGFNTLFDYPNNIYYTILAYMLAISFKIKQNGDITLLSGKLTEAENQFFDSINRDSNQFYTIKNVYKNGANVWL